MAKILATNIGFVPDWLGHGIRQKQAIETIYMEFIFAKSFLFYQAHWGRETYIRHQIQLSLGQIMACHLFGAMPLSEPMLDYNQLNHWEHISVKFS